MATLKTSAGWDCATRGHSWDWRDCNTRGDHYVCDFCGVAGFLPYDLYDNEPQEVAQ
jgi:predicted RNA-binding Zn-ribbon protein involved in translation (DUF1610 family)